MYNSITRGQMDVRIASVPGTRHPLDCTSLGNAILAALPIDLADHLLEETPLVRLSSNSNQVGATVVQATP